MLAVLAALQRKQGHPRLLAVNPGDGWAFGGWCLEMGDKGGFFGGFFSGFFWIDFVG